jgi:starch-binding outer membrane protein, SusD/RagB family
MKKILLNNKLKAFLLVGVLAFAGTSCEDSLLVDPRQSVDSATALESADAIRAALRSPYARLRSLANYGRNLIVFPEALADNGYVTQNSGRLIGETLNQPGAHFGHWTNSYYAINELNLVLSAMETQASLFSEAEGNGIIGEAKFLRGLYFFDLVRSYAYIPGAVVDAQNFGGVPLPTTGILDEETARTYQPSRAPIADVYTQIYADLQDAVARLGAQTTTYRASRNSANALLSRVALYNKDYALAESAATAALTGGAGAALSVGPAYVEGWTKDTHPESLFEVRFFSPNENIGVNESIQSSFTTIRSFDLIGNYTNEALGGWGDFAPLAANHASGLSVLPLVGVSQTGSGATLAIQRGADVRGQLFEIGAGRGSGRKIECIKFLGKTGTIYMDNVPVLRKSEMYLNRAEARATPGSAVLDLDLALADLNTVRVARGLDAYADATEIADGSVYEEILRERRKEFLNEGHRFFDMKRLGRNITKAGGAAGNPITFEDFRILPPIPQSEIDGNPNLVQNFGY